MANLIRSISQEYLDSGVRGVVNTFIGSAPPTETNEDVLNKLKPGDLIRIPRNNGYNHWAVYIGKKKVVHFSNDSLIHKDTFSNVVGEDKAIKANVGDGHWEPLDPKEIVRRAKYRVGKHMDYSVTNSNCEHFANWCRYNKFESRQSNNAASAAKAANVALGMVVAGPIGAVVGQAINMCFAPGQTSHQEEERKIPRKKKCCVFCCSCK